MYNWFVWFETFCLPNQRCKMSRNMHTTLAFHRIFLENPMMLYILLLFFLWICNIFCIMISEIWQTCILHLQSITSWLWSYGNYLCNQCISPLTLCVRIPLGLGLLDTTLYDQVCQWLAAGRWFSPVTLVSSTNKANRHDISEILLKVTLNTLYVCRVKSEEKLLFATSNRIGWKRS